MKNQTFILIALILVLMTGCADTGECVQTAEAAGFWSGLWHGAIIFFSFIGSLFSDDIAIYAVNNTGGWYDFGFFLGLSLFGGGASNVK